MATLVPLVFAVLMPAVFIRIAAPLARVVISWRLALSFGLIVAIVSMVERAFLSLLHLELPTIAAVVVGAGIYLAGGIWFFSRRGTTQAGEPLGQRGAFRFMLLYLVIAAAFLGFATAMQHFGRHAA